MRIARKSLVVVGTVAIAIGTLQGISHAAPAVDAPSVVGHLFPLAPFRLLDTREGNGAPAQPLGPNSTLHLQVTGRGGVPATGVSAVVLNVTVDRPSSASFLTVYPTGITRPNASNLNVTQGWIGANSVTVPVGTNGQVDIWNQAGNVSVIADVTGFYAADESAAASGANGQFYPNVPWRALDTREAGFKLGNGDWVQVAFNYKDGVKQHISAVALNVTAVNADSSGFLTAWSGAGPIPNASTLNYSRGAIVPNMAIIPTKPCDDPTWCEDLPIMQIQATTGGTVDVIIDVVGFFDDSQIGDGDNFHPLTPTRITDTRIGLGIGHPLTGGNSGISTQSLQASPVIDPAATEAVVSNVTGIVPTGPTFLTLWPPFGDPSSRPNASTLNLNTGDIRPNAAIIGIDYDNTFAVFNLNGTVNLVIDVAGTFDYAPAATTAVRKPKSSLSSADAKTRPTTGTSIVHAG